MAPATRYPAPPPGPGLRGRTSAGVARCPPCASVCVRRGPNHLLRGVMLRLWSLARALVSAGMAADAAVPYQSVRTARPALCPGIRRIGRRTAAPGPVSHFTLLRLPPLHLHAVFKEAPALVGTLSSPNEASLVTSGPTPRTPRTQVIPRKCGQSERSARNREAKPRTPFPAASPQIEETFSSDYYRKEHR